MAVVAQSCGGGRDVVDFRIPSILRFCRNSFVNLWCSLLLPLPADFSFFPLLIEFSFCGSPLFLLHQIFFLHFILMV